MRISLMLLHRSYVRVSSVFGAFIQAGEQGKLSSRAIRAPHVSVNDQCMRYLDACFMITG